METKINKLRALPRYPHGLGYHVLGDSPSVISSKQKPVDVRDNCPRSLLELDLIENFKNGIR